MKAIDFRQSAIVLTLIGGSVLPLPAADLTFTTWISGPRSVIQGDPVTLVSGGTLLTGSLKTMTATLTGIPTNTTLEYIWNITRYDAPPSITLGDSYGMHLITTKQTPLGTYPLTLTHIGVDPYGKKYTQSKTFDFVVRSLPTEPLKLPILQATPDLPAIAKWESNMIKYGSKHIANNRISCCGDDSGVWYYDGARAFLQIADYTGRPEFLTFARKIHDAYCNYVLTTTGTPLYRRFPHGLAQFYQRQNLLAAKQAVGKLQAQANPGERLHWGASWMIARDQAYSLSSHVVAERLGFPRNPLFQDHLSLTLGHFEQWFISHTAEFTYPFLVGLASEALIDYYEQSRDVRVPYLLKMAADWIWQNEWDPNSQSFWLIEKQNGVIRRYAAPDLNLMIAPLYGWVFQQTGDEKYRTIGDQIFTSGVEKAYLDGGKQFSQNYRWSFQYVEWRKTPSPLPQVLTPTLGGTLGQLGGVFGRN